MKLEIPKNQRRSLLLLLVFWFVRSEAANIGDFFRGYFDGAGNLPSQVQ